MSKITCETLDEFILVCAGLVREGILFEAWADDLTIKPTGGC